MGVPQTAVFERLRPALTRGYDSGGEEGTDIAIREDYTIHARHVRAFAVKQG